MVRVLAIGLMLSWPLWIAAAEAPAMGPRSVTNAASSTNLELLTAATAGTIYIVPGEGLNVARLGDRLDILVADWGPPQRQRNRGAIQRTREISYQLDEFSTIHFRGQERLQQIAVEGTPGSKLQTVEGAQFGIEPQQLMQIYGRPAKVGRDGKLDYPSLGIGFAFESNRLRRIAVYPASR